MTVHVLPGNRIVHIEIGHCDKYKRPSEYGRPNDRECFHAVQITRSDGHTMTMGTVMREDIKALLSIVPWSSVEYHESEHDMSGIIHFRKELPNLPAEKPIPDANELLHRIYKLDPCQACRVPSPLGV